MMYNFTKLNWYLEGEKLGKYDILKENCYRRFINTLNECGIFLISADDEKIGYLIFEEFDIDVRSNLCDNNLSMFISEGWIDESIEEKCRKLRDSFCEIQTLYPQIWNIHSIRISEKWMEILKLSDEIKENLYFVLP